MTRPVGRIEVWEPGAGSALYTINDSVGIFFKEIITEGVGNFNFACFSHKDFSGTYTYPDIDLGDTVKIWLDYDSIAGNPNFIGKVTKRSGPFLTKSGWVRRIAGLSQGEVLLRRLKKNKYYDAVAASTIVSEWAGDLNLGTSKIVSDSTQVTLAVETKKYFDLLRWISDYWASASVQIKKDFWVDTDGDLVWKNRPFRTTGVESFRTADFLEDPVVEREIESVKNDITVYGNSGKVGIPGDSGRTMPSDGDSWTVDDINNWVEVLGTISADTARKKVGSDSIKCVPEAGYYAEFKRDVTSIQFFGRPKYQTVNFWAFLTSGFKPNILAIRLFAPDANNYFQSDFSNMTASQWVWHSFQMGQNQEYDADKNPNGVWTKTGSPNWSNVQWVDFYYDNPSDNPNFYIDGFYFGHGRWRATASDYAGVDRRELEVIDDKLLSDNDCAKRAETLLYQLKDPPIQVTIVVQGNDNVLVGDRLTITIPSEGISAQPYDVIAVENLLNMENWTTKIIMVNSANWRVPLQLRQQIEMRRRIRELSIDEKAVL